MMTAEALLKNDDQQTICDRHAPHETPRFVQTVVCILHVGALIVVGMTRTNVTLNPAKSFLRVSKIEKVPNPIADFSAGCVFEVLVS